MAKPKTANTYNYRTISISELKYLSDANHELRSYNYSNSMIIKLLVVESKSGKIINELHTLSLDRDEMRVVREEINDFLDK